MEGNYIEGQTLVVELHNECYIGEFHFMSKDRTRIELVKVCDFQTGDVISGAQYFYKSDIKSIKVIKDDNKSVESCYENKKKTVSECELKRANLTTKELHEIEVLIKNAKYICQTDRLYHDAIRDMWKQSVIAINIESCEMGRHNKTVILTVCTRDNVYIFDITYLGRIFPEIKDLLEANKPRKIIHDGRKITDNLKFQQNIQMNSIFDTLVAHVAVGKEKNYTDLAGCVSRYLNLPDKFFICEKDIDWQTRPLDEVAKSITAKKVICIYKLYEVFLHDHMLQNFYEVCNAFANVYSSNSDSVEVASDMASNNNSSIDKISDVSCDLSIAVEEINLTE